MEKRNAPWRNTNKAKDIRKNPITIKETIMNEILKKNLKQKMYRQFSQIGAHYFLVFDTTFICNWHFCLTKSARNTLNYSLESYMSCDGYIWQSRNNFSNIE